MKDVMTPGGCVMTMFDTLPTGEEYKVMELTYTKREK